MLLDEFLRQQNDVRLVQSGRTLLCPACAKTARFPVFQKSAAHRATGIGLAGAASGYFTVCPLCGAVFAVKHTAGRLAARWPDFSLLPEYLELIHPSAQPKK